MYFIELINKIFTKKPRPKVIIQEKDDLTRIIEEEKTCDHVFVPIDKSSTVFGCVKCGLLVKGKPKNINFFEGDK